jgi:DNA excision repair protein ERCC-4
MSVHYKHPVLLIEFEEDKAFTLDVSLLAYHITPGLPRFFYQLVSELKSYAKPTGKYPVKSTRPSGVIDPDSTLSVQSKIALLTLSFPRVRIIWSSSPYASAQIFNDLKLNDPEPDPRKAIAVGADGDPDAGAGINAAAEEVLRTLPGINDKNIKYVMRRVKTVRELCDMSLSQVQDILGAEPGKACWEFIHRGERRTAVNVVTVSI